MTEAAAAFKSLLNDHAVSGESLIASLIKHTHLCTLPQVEDILADIPFFCVGILSFGVFTFLLLMKRSDRCAHSIAILHIRPI